MNDNMADGDWAIVEISGLHLSTQILDQSLNHHAACWSSNSVMLV
jgi:hypothetical protein